MKRKEEIIIKQEKWARRKEMLKNFASFLMICGFLLVFWVTLFYGIVDEAERRANQKSNRKWAHERAVNEMQTALS